MSPRPAPTALDDAIQHVLHAMRTHLGLDVAFISELDGGRRTFRYVDTEPDAAVIEVGGSDPAEESYCAYVARGELPELLRDPSRHPVSAALAVTDELPVGTHLSVPIRFSDGSVYGTFCCFGFEVTDWLDERDLAAVRMAATMVAEYLEDREGGRRQRDQRRRHLGSIEAGRGLEIVFQPIVALGTGDLVGVEALARFPRLGLGPAEVFAEAQALGISPELEMKAVRAAADHLDHLPEGAYLAVNVSPATLAHTELLAVARSMPPGRLVVEVTEHASIADDDDAVAAVEELAAVGARVAVDDAGAGFSGLEQIVRLGPHIVKVDMALVRGVDEDPARQAMVAALVTFAARTGTAVVAEGIETAAEMQALRVLGVTCGQGYHLGRPAALPGPGALTAMA